MKTPHRHRRRFRRRARGQRGGRAGAPRRHPHRRQPDGRGRRRRRCGRAGQSDAVAWGRPPSRPGRGPPDAAARAGARPRRCHRPFPHRHGAAPASRSSPNPRARRQLAAEIEAQFAAFAATGLPLDHVNAHKHFHLHPTIASAILEIGKRYGMKAVRAPVEPRAVLAKIEPGPAASTSRALWALLVRRRMRARRHDRARSGVRPRLVRRAECDAAARPDRRIFPTASPRSTPIRRQTIDYPGHAPGLSLSR